MTTKEIAEAVGRPEKTVRTWAFKVAAKSAEAAAKLAEATPSKPANWNLDETVAIIEYGMGKNAASLFRENAKRLPQNSKDTDDRIGRLETLMAAQIGMVEHLCKALAAIPAAMQRQALPDIQQDYFTIKGYAAKTGCRVAFSEAQALGRAARVLSTREGFDIRQVEDERFGVVNSYHVSVLEEVFQP
jgi:hypothetical protein